MSDLDKLPPDPQMNAWVPATEQFYTRCVSCGVICRDASGSYFVPAWVQVVWRANSCRSAFFDEGDAYEEFVRHLVMLRREPDLVEAMFALYLALRPDHDSELGIRLVRVREFLDDHLKEFSS